MKLETWLRANPRPLRTVSPQATVESVLEIFLDDASLREVYVAGVEGTLRGRLSRGALAQQMVGHHRPDETRRQLLQRITRSHAGELMQRHFPTARPDEEIDDVVHRLVDHEVDQLPVVDEQRRPLGAVDLLDVLRELADGLEAG